MRFWRPPARAASSEKTLLSGACGPGLHTLECGFNFRLQQVPDNQGLNTQNNQTDKKADRIEVGKRAKQPEYLETCADGCENNRDDTGPVLEFQQAYSN